MSWTKIGWNPTDQRQGRTAPNHGGEPAEEVIILAKHEARPDDSCLWKYLSDGLFSLGLRPVRDRRRCRAGAEGRYVDQACHAMTLCCQRNSAGAFDVNGAISLCGRLGENADEVDDGIRAYDRTAGSDVVKQISLDDLRRLGQFSRHLNPARMAYGEAHRRAMSEKQRHEMAADEAGSAEHRD
jgi:hypothetical protein